MIDKPAPDSLQKILNEIGLSRPVARGAIDPDQLIVDVALDLSHRGERFDGDMGGRAEDAAAPYDNSVVSVVAAKIKLTLPDGRVQQFDISPDDVRALDADISDDLTYDAQG